jgi:hypothetical protein
LVSVSICGIAAISAVFLIDWDMWLRLLSVGGVRLWLCCVVIIIVER